MPDCGVHYLWFALVCFLIRSQPPPPPNATCSSLQEAWPAIPHLPSASCTCITLPYKRGIDVPSLRLKFQALQPSLLLFLHRLRALVVVDGTARTSRVMRREDIADGVARVTTATKAEADPGTEDVQPHCAATEYLLVSRTLDPPPDITRDGLAIPTTAMSLAFPLASLDPQSPDASLPPLPPQPVSAFLPLRSYGFRFLLHADWLVPASREAIREDSAWNAWLRVHVPELFVEALQRLRQHYEGRVSAEGGGRGDEGEARVEGERRRGPKRKREGDETGEGVEATEGSGAGDGGPAPAIAARLLQFLPVEGEVQGWFAPTGAHVAAAVRGHACLVSASGDWVLPRQLLACGDAQLLRLVPPSLLRQTLGLSYLHPRLLALVSPATIAALRVPALHAGHLLDVVGALLEQGPLQVPLVWLAEWLTCCLRLAQSPPPPALRPGRAAALGAPAVLSRLRALPVVPLEGGGFVALAEHPGVFLPPAGGGRRGYAFEGAMEVVSADFMRSLGDAPDAPATAGAAPGPGPAATLRDVLCRMGARPAEPAAVLEHFVLPLLEAAGDPQTSGACPDEAALVSALAFVKDVVPECRRSRGLWAGRRARAALVTSQGLRRGGVAPVHFSAAYDNPLDLRALLPDPCFVSNLYLRHRGPAPADPRGNVAAWRTFLADLSVTDFFAVQPTVRAVPRGDAELGPIAGAEDWAGHCEVEDFECPEFGAVMQRLLGPPDDAPPHRPVTVSDDVHAMLCGVWAAVDQHWRQSYSHCLQRRYRCAMDKALLHTTPSSFLRDMRRWPWVPCADVGRVARPRDLYARTEELQDLLAHHVPYAHGTGQSRGMQACARASVLCRQRRGLKWVSSALVVVEGNGYPRPIVAEARSTG